MYIIMNLATKTYFERYISKAGAVYVSEKDLAFKFQHRKSALAMKHILLMMHPAVKLRVSEV